MGVKEGQKCRQNGRNGTRKEVNFRYAYNNNKLKIIIVVKFFPSTKLSIED